MSADFEISCPPPLAKSAHYQTFICGVTNATPAL
jgi:hypothetical protein